MARDTGRGRLRSAAIDARGAGGQKAQQLADGGYASPSFAGDANEAGTSRSGDLLLLRDSGFTG